MLKLVNIKKDYKIASGTVNALKGIDLAFRPNEFVCILGPSGCGKTTLLNIIGGLDHYTSGDLVIQGKSTKDFKDRDWDVYRNHRIGFIFQSYNLIPHQSVLGNVELALTIAGVGREERRERAKKALERVGLGDELNKLPNQLSGGQMQRVAIARALVNNPDILLADEPTGALDSKTSIEVMELIKEIAGERLVVMVTHNPDLAEKYASRIVRLKDGVVESDSDPYEGENAPAKEEGEGKLRARMSFLTSLALSARNLLTKKGRTIVTSVAGSIGIISVCLVLALSSGFGNYIRRTEEDMLSYYPLQISETAFDMTSVMAAVQSPSEMPDLSQLKDKVYVNSFLTGIAHGMAVRNDITQEYLDYIEDIDPDLCNAVMYGYGVGLADNLFMTVETGGIDGGDGHKSEIVEKTFSISALKDYYISELRAYAPQYNSLIYMADFFGDIVNKMPGTTDSSDENYAKYVLSQYDVIAGEFPVGADENGVHGATLVVGDNNDVTDMTLAQLGFLDEATFISPFLTGEAGEWDHKFDFKDILGKKYVMYYNDALYERNESYFESAIPRPNTYPFTYNGQRDDLTVAENEGIEIEVKAILRLKDGYTYGCLTEGLNLTEETVLAYLAGNKKSEIADWMKNSSKLPDALLQLAGGSGALPEGVSLYLSPAANLNSYYTAMEQSAMGQYYIAYDPERPFRYIGGDDTPNSVSLYPRDFDSKELVLRYLDDWNTNREESEKITYTDTVGLLMGMVQTMLNVITYVLVAFTAISLVVSSVMIGIITYVSVVERVKEIGVLRSLGARKRDIKNLFNAETFIIGLSAGIIGIAVTYLLSALINFIIFSLSGISGIAALPPLTAFIMVVVSVALTLISGLIPAAAAAKKDPVIALRTE